MIMNQTSVADTIGRLIAAQTVEGYEISITQSRNVSIEVKDQKTDTFKCSAPVGVSVRIFKAGGMGFSYSTSLAEPDLERMVAAAVVAADNQTADVCNGFPERREFPEIAGMFDETLAGVGEQRKIQYAMELERLTLAADPRMKRVRQAAFSESEYHVYLRNSRGVEGSYCGTSVSASVSAVAEEGEDSQMGWDFGFGTGFADIHVEKIAAAAAARALSLLGARKIPTMRCPVVLDNHVASEILEVLASSFLAENVLKGKSMLADRRGDRVFSSLVHIRDNGILPGGVATAPFDAEGVPQQNTLVVSEGDLSTFLYDTYWARRDGATATGNASRGGIKSPPHLSVTNFYLENGTTAVRNLADGIARGILITDVMGMHTANPISGDFSVGASGFFLENGAIAYPVKEIALSGNILELFAAIEAVGDDLRFFGGIGAPSLRVAALDVSGQ